MVEQGNALRRLREEVDRSREVDQVEILLPLDDNRRIRDLTRQSHHFGVAALAEDHHLTANRAHLLVRLDDALLQLRHHGAGGVNHLDTERTRCGIGRGGLAVGSDKEARAAEGLHLGVGDGVQSQPFEALHLHTVVDNITQRIDRATLLQGALGLGDGTHHPETESRFIVDLDPHRLNELCDALHDPLHLLLDR